METEEVLVAPEVLVEAALDVVEAAVDVVEAAVDVADDDAAEGRH